MSVFKVFCIFFKTALRNFPILCMIIDDNRVHCLSYIAFMKKDITGLKGDKCPIFKVLAFFFKTVVRVCPIFCMVVEGNLEHCLSQRLFLKIFWITYYMGLSTKEWCLGCFPQKWCYGGSIPACSLLFHSKEFGLYLLSIAAHKFRTKLYKLCFILDPRFTR